MTNITELLKDCPSGMELDCTCADNVVFDKIIEYKQIKCVIGECRDPFILDKYGRLLHLGCPKCVIFPKGKTTWEGFVPPCKFKDGDVCYVKTKELFEYIFIFKVSENYDCTTSYVTLSAYDLYTDISSVCATDSIKEIRLATEEEIEKLVQAIKDNGYKWDAETKTLEKLVTPKFNVGDVVRLKSKPSYIYTIYCLAWDDNKKLAYKLLPKNDKHLILVSLNTQDDYELIPDKFNITTLKPFDKVLVRCGNNGLWNPQFFAKYRPHSKFPFTCTYNSWSQCVPYEGNEHLLDTTDDCDDFYKTWE